MGVLGNAGKVIVLTPAVTLKVRVTGVAAAIGSVTGLRGGD